MISGITVPIAQSSSRPSPFHLPQHFPYTPKFCGEEISLAFLFAVLLDAREVLLAFRA